MRKAAGKDVLLARTVEVSQPKSGSCQPPTGQVEWGMPINLNCLRLLPALMTMASLLSTQDVQAADKPTLAERLGYKATDKLLIVNGDDAGMCHPANLATIACMEKGMMRSATIMVPCPWFPELVGYAGSHPEKSFGVHLTHTSEWERYRWAPVAGVEKVPGLVDMQGYLWPSIEEVYAHGSPEEALVEGRAQIKKALSAKIDVTHLDSHMGTLQLDPRFVETYLKLAVEFDLPVRMASLDTLTKFGFPQLRDIFASKGILFPDDFVYETLKEEKKDVRGFWLDAVKKLKPGVTELYIHAALPTDEMKAITGSWSTRSQEYEVFTNDEEMKKIVADQGIILISYKPIRELQHKERKK
jgi:predicted glycoside hydrolase/deacetylase ChbG (UPF0249 family)